MMWRWISEVPSQMRSTRASRQKRASGRSLISPMRPWIWIASSVTRASISEAYTGSSPLARGTPGAGAVAGPGRRFIPARAGNTALAPGQIRRTTVHPRSRGEHLRCFRGMAMPIGSSPLARGTLSPAYGRKERGRFIPARAGNTTVRLPGLLPCPVHPRSRGEHRGCAEGATYGIGSSPLARGTPSGGAGAGPARRFIPARAGNTSLAGPAIEPGAVHPRSRGEHRCCPMAVGVANGSSPLARGTPHPDGDCYEGDRFIPARAGNTGSCGRRAPSGPVHPRSRGEHGPRRYIPSHRYGSSPLARGTHTDSSVGTYRCRFIPARAGNTPDAPRQTSSTSVHPRSRGEHPVAAPLAVFHAGSSPLARGTQGVDEPCLLVDRFIPARAGNTDRSGTYRPVSTVHPRSRGEHATKGAAGYPRVGSSPLARGTPARPL